MATLTCRPTNLKRKSSPDEDVFSKRIRIILEEDGSSTDFSDEAESIYSAQNQDTATAHDTSDTEEADEYEVETHSEGTLSELSSGPENCVVIGDFASIVDEFGSEISYVADLSETYSSSDDEIEKSFPKRCEKCKGVCEEPFTLCLKCFRQKRIYLPPRPKGKRKRNRGCSPTRADSGFGSQGSLGSQGSREHENIGQGVDNLVQQEASLQGSQEAKNLCKCCFASPVDGVFIHKNTVHPMYCYTCSVKQWRLRGRCPFCNQKLCKVAKIFPVED